MNTYSGPAAVPPVGNKVEDDSPCTEERLGLYLKFFILLSGNCIEKPLCVALVSPFLTAIKQTQHRQVTMGVPLCPRLTLGLPFLLCIAVSVVLDLYFGKRYNAFYEAGDGFHPNASC